jgi:hypothetical protein
VQLDDGDTVVELFPDGQARVEVSGLQVFGSYAEGYVWVEADGTSREASRYLTWQADGDKLASRQEAAAVRAVLKMVPRARRVARESLRHHTANAKSAKDAAMAAGQEQQK